MYGVRSIPEVMAANANLYRTATEWYEANPVLAAGQIGVEKFTKKKKVGDGVTPWNNLVYMLEKRDLTDILGASSIRPQTLMEPFWGALAKRNSRRVNLALMGASVIEGFPVSSYDLTVGQKLAGLLRAAFPTTGAAGGRGFVPVPTAGVAWNTPVVVTGGAVDPVGTGSPPAFGIGGNKNCWYTNGTGTIQITAGSNATHVDIVNGTGSAGGAAGGYYQVNSGAVVPFNTYSAVAAANLVRVACAPGDVIKVGCNTFGQYVIIGGFIELGGTATKGIEVHNCGHAGFSALDWSTGAPSGGWRDDIALMNPDLLVISDMGANDKQKGRTSIQFKTDLQALINTIRAGLAPLPTVPILLVSLYNADAGLVGSEAWPNYVAKQAEVADDNATSVRHLDLSQLMPPTSPDPLGIYAADHVHGNADGSAYELIARHIFTAIKP